jgi:outer membrane protein assembly factor BamB
MRLTMPDRRTIKLVASTVAIALLLLIAGRVAWRYYTDWRLGGVVLTNEGAPLTVQVLCESDDTPIGEPVELIGRATLTLPAGDYRLRVTGEGRFGQTYRVAVVRGESSTRTLTLDDNRLLGETPMPLDANYPKPRGGNPIPFVEGTVAIELSPGKADLIEVLFKVHHSKNGTEPEWLPSRLGRRDGATGELIWDALEPRGPGEPARTYHPWIQWLAIIPGNRWLMNPAPDLDGDGTRDLVWVLGAEFLAVSGKDGSVLWTYLAEPDGPGGAHPEGPERPSVTRDTGIVGDPATADLDRDGVPDIIANVAFKDPAGENLIPRAVVAVSGRSGRRLWAHPLKADVDWPYHPGSGVVFLRGRRSATVAVVHRTAWIGLDPADGRKRTGPIDLGFAPLQPVQYADLDGDGEPEILATGPRQGINHSLTAFSIEAGRPLWSTTDAVRYEATADDGTVPVRPLVADLDGDGRAEVAVPDASDPTLKDGYRGVRLLDGATGLPRWTRPMHALTQANDGVIELIEAPDLDRDGVRDLVVTSLFHGRQPVGPWQGGPDEPERQYVDALSGKDGRPLWWWHLDGKPDITTDLRTPRWWGRGPDGWPLLAVPAEIINWLKPAAILPADADPPTVHMLEASTGREVQSLAGFEEMQVADLDGDGLTDLWGNARGVLRAFRGEPPEAWRALGRFERARASLRTEVLPAADLDGDGIGDALIARLTAPGPTSGRKLGSRTAMARSGRDGRLLWSTDLGLDRSWFEADRDEWYSLWTAPMPAGDLDGDGTPDVVVGEGCSTPPARAVRRPATLPLTLLSGRTGRPVWMAGALPLPFEAHGHSHVHWATPRIVEPGAAADLIVWHNGPSPKASPTPPPGGPDTRPHLARVSGRTGRILWDLEVSDRPNFDLYDSVMPFPKFEDLDGDDRLDILLAMYEERGGAVPTFALQAISLHDGRRLWSRTFDHPEGSHPGVAIADAGDPARPIVAVLSRSPGTGDQRLSVRAFDGRDGRPRWSWSREEDPDGIRWHRILAARPGPGGERRICVSYAAPGRRQQMAFLDGEGREARRRDWPGQSPLGMFLNGNGLQARPRDWPDEESPRVADLDGDGRDELILRHDGPLRAWDTDLRETWSHEYWPIEEIVPASRDRPAWLLLDSGVFLDGKTGRPAWLTVVERPLDDRPSPGSVLDPGDAARPPLLIAHQVGTTIVRTATAATPAGAPVPPGRADGDPRWIRPLPWTGRILHTIGPKGFLAFMGLALVNVAVPLAILWLAARRRPWTVRVLLALPIAAAIPLTVFQTIEPLVPAQIGTQPVSSKVVFALATIAGVPIVVLGVVAAWSLVRRRWKAFAWIAGFTVAASALIAAVWLGIDSRAMPAIEHYSRSDWYLAAVPGAYAVGVLIPVAWTLRAAYRILRRPRRVEVEAA